MKMYNRITALIIAVALVISFTASAAVFSDTNGHSLEEHIDRAVEIGFINGFTDGTFRPDETLTRAQFCKMLCETLGIYNVTRNEFSDVNYGDWFFDYVNTAVSHGFINGFTDGTFRPNETVTRYQAAVMLDRLVDIVADTGRDSFADSDKAPAWATGGVIFAARSGFFDSFITDTFEGDKFLTRAQAAAVISAMYDSFEKKPVFVFSCPNLGTYVSKTERVPKNFYICGKGLFSGLGLETIESNDTDKWISALETIIQFETQTSENLELAGEGIYSFSYVSDDCIAVNYYVAPTENVPAKIMLTCVLSEKCAERFALSGNGTAVYDLDRFYDFISVYDEINYYQTVENGVIEKYLAFKCNTDPRELIILVSVCDTYFNAYDSKYIRAGEITTDSEGITRIRMTNTLNSIMDSLKGSYAYPYTCLTIAAPYSEGKSQAYYAGQVLFSNMNTLGVTHNGKKSAEVGEMKKGENMIIGLDILDLYSAMEILNPDKALYTISYTMSDEKGSVCNGGFNLKVAGENMAPDEPFLINDLMSLNIENLSAFGELTADETVKPGVYTMCVVFKVYEDTGAEVYSEAKYVSFVLK